MPNRSERKDSKGSKAAGPRTDSKGRLEPEPELEALLREAQEVLRGSDVPSGGWDMPVELAKTAAVDGWLGGMPQIQAGISLDGIDPETAFWLLFPPRGTA